MSSICQKEIKKESAVQKNFEMIVKARMQNKIFSKIFPTKSSDLTLLSEPAPDPFQDLRYDEALASRKDPLLIVWDPVVSVLVKRPLAYQPPVAKPFALGLQLAVDERRQPLELYEPVSRFTRSVVETLKRDKGQRPWCQDAMLRGRLANQEHALHAWKDREKFVAKETARISKKIGRPAAELLLSTPLRLPPLGDHQGTSHGPGQDWMPHRVGPAESSIDTSPTWSERKYYNLSSTNARRRLEDTLPASLRDGKRYQDQERARSPFHQTVDKGTASWPHYPLSFAICSSDDDYDTREDTAKAPSTFIAPPNFVLRRPCLMVQDIIYSWGEPGPQDLVEVGFVCLAGERAYNQIRLANMGKTVIRCFWCKPVHSDHFNKGHYRVEHFIFDFSDRILLPCDQVTLKVQFHADYPGFWREVWHLKTEPALGPGGSSTIPISLWARTLAANDNDSRRKELECQLDVLTSERRSVSCGDQRHKKQPQCDYDTILPQRLLVTEDIFVVDDVEVFEQANPGLSYHGHAMFTILKVYRKVRKVRRPEIQVDLVEDIEDFSLEQYQRIPEKTEESSKVGKTQKVVSSKRRNKSVEKCPISEEIEPRRVRSSRKAKRKKDKTRSQILSKIDVPRKRTEVDALLEGDPADEDPLERRKISVKGIYNMVRELDKRFEEKDNMFMELNQAVSDMSFRRGQPIVTNFKLLVCRTALCQAADDVAAIAQRLEHNLRLSLRHDSSSGITISTDSNDSGVKMVTAVQPTSKSDLPNTREDRWPRRKSPSRNIRVKQISKIDVPRRSVPLDDVADESIHMTSAGEIDQVESVYTGSHEMYRNLLYVLVYERVERLLLDLLPLITDDEQQLDPLKPRPEL